MADRLSSVIARLRELNEPVPKPLRRPTEEEVDAAERDLGVTFHPDYRRFLLEASDVSYGTYEPASVTVRGGYLDLRDVAREAWDDWEVPRDLLPFCKSEADFFCLNQAGEVVYMDHNGWTDEKWPDLATWIEEVWIEGN